MYRLDNAASNLDSALDNRSGKIILRSVRR